MAKPAALRALQGRLQMVVRGQTDQANRDILHNHVLKWKEVQKPIQVMKDADQRVPGWGFREMLEKLLLTEIGKHQRRQGRIATGKNRKYIKIFRAIQNGNTVVDTKLSDLKEARAFYADHLEGLRARLYRIDMIIEVAEEWGVEVITNAVIEEADKRIVA